MTNNLWESILKIPTVLKVSGKSNVLLHYFIFRDKFHRYQAGLNAESFIIAFQQNTITTNNLNSFSKKVELICIFSPNSSLK